MKLFGRLVKEGSIVREVGNAEYVTSEVYRVHRAWISLFLTNVNKTGWEATLANSLRDILRNLFSQY